MRHAALLVAAVGLAGCVTPTVAPEPGVPLSADDPRPAALVGSLVELAAARDTMRGVLRVAVDAPDARFRTTQRVAAERPARLRVEILGLFGQVAAVLATDGREYQYLDVGSGDRSAGPVTPDLLWEVARVDLDPREAVGLLLGAPDAGPPLAIAGAAGLEDGVVRVRLADGDGAPRRVLWFDALGRLVRLEAIDGLGQRAWEARFSDLRDDAGGPYPERVDLDFPRTGARATVEIRSVELNAELAPQLFVLDPPGRLSRAAAGRSAAGWSGGPGLRPDRTGEGSR